MLFAAEAAALSDAPLVILGRRGAEAAATFEPLPLRPARLCGLDIMSGELRPLGRCRIPEAAAAAAAAVGRRNTFGSLLCVEEPATADDDDGGGGVVMSLDTRLVQREDS